MRKAILASVGACLLGSVAHAQPSSSVKPDLELGKTASATCVACHQADGGGRDMPEGESWPRLAGLDAEYLLKQMRDFKSGARSNATMQVFAQMLSDEQMVHVTAYYASLPVPATEPATAHDPDLLEAGRKLATQGDWERYIVPCQSCHGPDNQGAGPAFPGIAGQHAHYISAQLVAWQKGTRANDPLDLMGTIAKRMTADDIRAVAAWLSTQKADSAAVDPKGRK